MRRTVPRRTYKATIHRGAPRPAGRDRDLTLASSNSQPRTSSVPARRAPLATPPRPIGPQGVQVAHEIPRQPASTPPSKPSPHRPTGPAAAASTSPPHQHAPRPSCRNRRCGRRAASAATSPTSVPSSPRWRHNPPIWTATVAVFLGNRKSDIGAPSRPDGAPNPPHNVHRSVGQTCPQPPAQRERDRSTQNSLPSGSASTIHDRSPCPMSARVAPSASSRSTSTSRSSGRKSRCNRFLLVFDSRDGDEEESRQTIRSGSNLELVGVVADDYSAERRLPPHPEAARIPCIDDCLLPLEAHEAIVEPA